MSITSSSNHHGLDIIKIIDNPLISRAQYTFRYSSSKLIDPENLPTHIYDVAMIGLFLMDRMIEVSDGEEKFNREDFLMKAIFHDADESILGDTPRPLKYASPDIKESIDQVAHRVAENLFETSFFNSDEVCQYYFGAKSGKTGMLVKIADMLCVIKKLRSEVEKLNNYTLLDVITNSKKYVDELDVENTYRVFDTTDAKQYLSHIFQELKEYLDYMDTEYLHRGVE